MIAPRSIGVLVLVGSGCSAPAGERFIVEAAEPAAAQRAPDDGAGKQSDPLPASPPAGEPAEPPAACAADDDCRYDPEHDRCGSDPRYNPQPPLIDQGIVCYCDEQRCALFRAPPVPCESDASCAVRPDPRPHPVAASAAFPHQRGRACKDYRLSTTCERTNICTMHRHACPAP